MGEETLLLPEERLLSREAVEHLRDAIAQLPLAQQAVIGLRDVEGFSPEEVAAALDISPGNERVLLHRARSRGSGTHQATVTQGVVLDAWSLSVELSIDASA